MTIIKFLSILFTLCASIVLPVFLVIFVSKKYKVKIRFAFLGALGFVVMQLFIRIPLLQLPAINIFLIGLSPVLSAMALAFTAALFETTGRYLVFKLFFSKEHSFASGLMGGIGHGGIEAIALIGTLYINNIIIASVLLFAPNGSLANSLGINEAMANSFSTISSFMFAGAGIERICTIAFHAFISVMLFYFMQKHKTWLGFTLAIIMHTTVDFSIPMLNMIFANTQMPLALIVLFGIMSIIGIVYFKKIHWPSKATAQEEGMSN
ncbi:MAG: YhfC family glutamic-type intramembrane protease [Oscillospiraceae bacterium]